jgi:hypothetical protein
MIRCLKISSVYCFPALFKLLRKRVLSSIASIKTVAAAGNAARKSTFRESPQDEENSIFEADALSIFLFRIHPKAAALNQKCSSICLPIKKKILYFCAFCHNI